MCWSTSKEAWPAGWRRWFWCSWDLTCSAMSNSVGEGHELVAMSAEESLEDDQGTETPHLWTQAKRIGVVYSRVKKATETPYSNFPLLKGRLQKHGEGLFKRIKGQRTKVLDWKREIKTKSKEGNVNNESGKTLEQVAKRSCGFLLPGRGQGQVGWVFEQPGLADVFAHIGLGPDDL